MARHREILPWARHEAYRAPEELAVSLVCCTHDNMQLDSARRHIVAAGNAVYVYIEWAIAQNGERRRSWWRWRRQATGGWLR